MKIHILGICGTFMGGIARLAIESGHQVSGSDANVYPPMSDQLSELGINPGQGYAAAHIGNDVDQVIIGNTLSRGNPAVEHVLDDGIPYTSGPQWLFDNVLLHRQVMAIAGTHGKTTTTSMLAWILEAMGKQPGFLIGGVAGNFGISASLGNSDLFVIEADEYDTAFFDKRSKFVHYRPRTLIINNIEFDHADIFTDIKDIVRQFRHLLRTVPASGQVIINEEDSLCMELAESDCRSTLIRFGSYSSGYSIKTEKDDFSQFDICYQDRVLAPVRWDLIGRHNALNALAAVIAAEQAGIAVTEACPHLQQFRGVKRRMEKLAEIRGIHIYDDFAHHPTEISASLNAMRSHIGDQRLVAVLEPRTNTMKMGLHRDQLGDSLAVADHTCLFQPAGLDWDLAASIEKIRSRCVIYRDTAAILDDLGEMLGPGDHVVIMSNGGFDNIHQRLVERLQ